MEVSFHCVTRHDHLCRIITSIIIKGELKGFLKNDGTFLISKVPSGSYVVDILNPNYVYEPVRVEINNKGKFRARKVNVSCSITRCTGDSRDFYQF